MLTPLDDEDDCSDTMSRSTARRTLGQLRFNIRMMRSFGNSPVQAFVKGFRMWRGATVYIMPQRSAFQ